MCLGGYTSDTLLSAPKHAPLTLQLQASGRQLSLTKNPGESAEHLVLKALLWALLLPSHPEAKIEADLGLRYTPDVVALGDDSTPIWWGECGSVKSSKLSDLASAYPNARFSVAKWGRSDLRGYAATLSGELALPPLILRQIFRRRCQRNRCGSGPPPSAAAPPADPPARPLCRSCRGGP